MAIGVRELPPLRLTYAITTPTGKRYRWAGDEPRAQNVPAQARFSSTAPGGHENLETTLARKPGVDYSDTAPLSTITASGVGGRIAWQGRLERAPAVSGDQMSVTPQAVGWQAHLDDNKTARFLGLDRDMTHWAGAPLARRVALGASAFDGIDMESIVGATPTIRTALTGIWSRRTEATAFYDAGPGAPIGKIIATWQRTDTVLDNTSASWVWDVLLSDDEALATSEGTGTLRAAGPGTATLTAAGTQRRYGWLRLYYTAGPAGSEGIHYPIDWTNVAVVGNHGLTLHPDSDGDSGLLASDIVAAVVRAFAPRLALTTGADGTVTPSTFVLPHFASLNPGPASGMVTEATRFGLQDWFVWDGPTFYWHPRGARGRHWRTRVGPSQLQETGPQVERIWDSVTVAYQDVDGSTRTVGPPGSGADTTSSELVDPDPTNPATVLGISRRDLLQAGVMSAAAAVELGRRFLTETKTLDRSGQARVVGYVEDDRGVIHPYWAVRAGDDISFVDAADTSPRRVVRVEHDVLAATCTMDLDAPPDGLDALLARLQVRLVPLGL